MKYFAILLLCVGWIHAIPTHPDIRTHNLGSRIIGGKPAHSVQFPYAASLQIHTADASLFCGGTLLGHQWVLTSAQCVDQATMITIVMGGVSLTANDPNRIRLATSNYVIHPDYDSQTLAHDIALVEFRQNITFTDFIKPVDRLPVSEVPDFVTVSAFGWGQTSDADPSYANELNWVTVSTITNEECKLTYGSFLTDNNVCVIGNLNEGSCYGDTGASLIQYYAGGRPQAPVAVPVGVASFISSNGCESENPSGYTRTYPYNSWIREVTKLTL